jgi:hypothetical protein
MKSEVASAIFSTIAISVSEITTSSPNGVFSMRRMKFAVAIILSWLLLILSSALTSPATAVICFVTLNVQVFPETETAS